MGDGVLDRNPGSNLQVWKSRRDEGPCHLKRYEVEADRHPDCCVGRAEVFRECLKCLLTVSANVLSHVSQSQAAGFILVSNGDGTKKTCARMA